MAEGLASELSRVNWWGVAFVLVGVWWLLDELGYLEFSWGVVGPIVLIIVGLGMITDHLRSED